MPGQLPSRSDRLCVSVYGILYISNSPAAKAYVPQRSKGIAALADRRKIQIFRIERLHSGFFGIWYVRCCS